MVDGEQLIAERTVPLTNHHALTVSISRHTAEEFWRVDVTNPEMARGHLSTTVEPGDNFLMNLIQDAVSGEQVAWRHLAQWGHANLSRAPGGPRAACA